MTPSPSPLAIDTVVWSIPEPQVAAALRTRPLLVLLHGFGSFAGDLIQLGTALQTDAVLASIQAPLVAPEPIRDGYAWFLGQRPGDPDRSDVEPSVAAVLTWLDALQASVDAPFAVGLLGFSQGGVMVTELFRRAPERFATGVLLSGFTVAAPAPADAALAGILPPLFWGRDTADPIITPAAVARAAALLPRLFTVTERTYAGIGHGVSLEELADVRAFLAATLA